MNYKLLIQYDGTDFHGWQIQESDRTIQGELEQVISTLEGKSVRITGSGRTDAGVHAEGQVANVFLNQSFTPEKLGKAINGNLCRDIRIMDVEAVSDDFHARFSARQKTYVYRVINARIMSPFWRRFAHHESRPLDIARMKEAAELFIGEHDWTAFSSAHADSDSKVREIRELTIISKQEDRAGSSLIEFHITADGFLRYMVRSIVGTLLEVGRNEKGLDAIKTAIATGDRKLAGPTATAKGLTLLKVEYD